MNCTGSGILQHTNREEGTVLHFMQFKEKIGTSFRLESGIRLPLSVSGRKVFVFPKVSNYSFAKNTIQTLHYDLVLL